MAKLPNEFLYFKNTIFVIQMNLFESINIPQHTSINVNNDHSLVNHRLTHPNLLYKTIYDMINNNVLKVVIKTLKMNLILVLLLLPIIYWI